jgi:tRNA1(Val) A37 N6-methylase TrmN6
VDELTSDAITASYRLLQRRRGHRFSLDDLATAWVAAGALPSARRVADLGCGVGSVLLMVAWKLPEAQMIGVEAQEGSLSLARRNVAENGLAPRVVLIHGDLREVTRAFPHAPCDLVTGTPPYLPPGTALASPDPQRAACRIELRGGVEDYLAGAARILAEGEGGLVVVCADGRAPERVLRGAAAAGLVPRRRLDVIARAGAEGPLFSVWTVARAGEGGLVHEAVTMRDEAGERTPEARAMRTFFGLG